MPLLAAVIGFLPVLAAAQAPSPRPAAESAAAPNTDTTARVARQQAARVRPRVRPSALSRAADSIGRYLVFPPRGQRWFVAAARNKQLYVDLGRVDLKVDDAGREAFREAVAARAPLAVGATVRLRGAWGVEDAVVTGYDAWSGRVVATVDVSAPLDSLARERGRDRVPSLAGSALLLTPADSAATEVACDREMPAALAARVAAVRDSTVLALRALPVPGRRVPQPANTILRTTERAGCFGAGRAAVLVHLRAPDGLWAHQRLLLVSESGAVVPLRVLDYRFKAHELLDVFDADGDGVDDLATRAFAEAMGGVSILAVDPQGKRAVRVANGFAWEAR